MSRFSNPTVSCPMKKILVAFALINLLAAPAHAETVQVKYRGQVNLAKFECVAITRSSFIRRVCYDLKNQYLIIKLHQTYYHYCEIGADTVAALKVASSMGRYYNLHIKSRGGDGPFDCRTHRVPKY